MSATHLGKYRLIRLLATGGMGEVFLARQEGPAGFSKPVVVKRILAHLARDPSFIEMFLNEARVAALLTHPNVVQVFELGEEDDVYYIAMEYVHGRSLRHVRAKLAQRAQAFPPGQAARIAAQALHALHYAHTAIGEGGEPLNIIHRDISPDNVMVGFNGSVKVLDFGIAKATTAITTTRTGTVKGKYAYMSPEQMIGTPLDGRADVYSVGVLLYELLAGVRPFVAPTEPALVNMVLTKDATPLREKAPHISEALADIVMTALSKQPDKRFANAEEMAKALEACASTEGESLTNAGSSSFITGLFGDEAQENLLLTTPTGERAAVGGVARPSLSGLKPVRPPASEEQEDDGSDLPPPPPQPNRGTPSGRQKPVRATPPTVGPPSGRILEMPSSLLPRAPSRFKRQAPYWAAAAGVLLVGAGIGYSRLMGNGAATVEVGMPVVQRTETPKPVAALTPDASVAAGVDAGADVAVIPSETPDASVAENPGGAPAASVALNPLGSPDASVAGVAKPVVDNRPARGFLDLRVSPWAEVYEGEKSLGVTPMPPLEMSSGTHRLTLNNSDLQMKKDITVKIPRGGTFTLRVDLLD